MNFGCSDMLGMLGVLAHRNSSSPTSSSSWPAQVFEVSRVAAPSSFAVLWCGL